MIKAEQKKKEIDAAPASVLGKNAKNNFIKQTANEFDYVPQGDAENVDLGLLSDPEFDSDDGDFNEYDKKV